MIYQLDYTVTRGDEYIVRGDYSRIIRANTKQEAINKFDTFIGKCKYILNEIYEL
jgi:hypothetical protein